MPTSTKKAIDELRLEPMRRLDVSKHDTVSSLLGGMAKTAFTGRTLGEAADVLAEMLEARGFVVLTISGAMTMAGLSMLAIEMIQRGWVSAVVATGALVGHGLTEDIGLEHFKADPSISDERYFELRLNRVYDVLEPESNLNRLEAEIRPLLDQVADDAKGPVGSHEILNWFGTHLSGAGILQAAATRSVPVYIPALTDSELGLDLSIHGQLRADQGKEPLVYDAFRDLVHYAESCRNAVDSGKKLGIFTVGGGVPRNWAQQVGPYCDICNTRLGRRWTVPRFSYGIRLCPDPVHFGHLSGCTYSEGTSWGKFAPVSEGGRYAEVLTDATIAWPLLVRAMIERGF